MRFFEDCDGVTEARGFFASGVHCDVKGNRNGKLDLGVIYSPHTCHAAGVFTTNDIKAAPVTLCQEILKKAGNSFHAIVANSGNANACTGAQGELDAKKMLSETARHLKIKPDQVLVCSTGRIGVPLPMSKITAGIGDACNDVLDELDGGEAFQEAILTSDTCTKSCSAKIETSSGVTITIGGVVKGAGMIQPDMATMLAFICSDASVSPSFMQTHLSRAVAKSFNRITIDGDMSTNDSVLFLTNGSTGVDIEKEPKKTQDAFIVALEKICSCLARKCVSDGEKVTKFVRVLVEGAKDVDGAEKIARAIANSLLVKSSWFGSDPNWGRIIDAAGYARTGIQFQNIDLFYDSIPALLSGVPQVGNKSQWKEIVSKKSFLIRLNLNQGSASEEIWSNDLSEAYVSFNKSE